MRSHQGNKMKKIILTAVLLMGALQADVVHYDKRDTKKPEMTKPNHPSTGLYIKK